MTKSVFITKEGKEMGEGNSHILASEQHFHRLGIKPQSPESRYDDVKGEVEKKIHEYMKKTGDIRAVLSKSRDAKSYFHITSNPTDKQLKFILDDERMNGKIYYDIEFTKGVVESGEGYSNLIKELTGMNKIGLEKYMKNLARKN